MKKYLWMVAIVVVALGIGILGSAFAGTETLIQAGVAAAVRGDVKATTPPDNVPHALKSGDKVFMGDRIEAGADGQLQVLLLDQTVFTLGPLSTITVDEFAYNPANDDGKVKASVLKGIFRVVSGKVAHKKPENMSVDLPAGSIGFRGTIVAGKSEGFRSLVALLGPLESEGDRAGHIYVTNIVNGEVVGVDIDQKGYGTVIEGPNTAPVPAFKISEDELSKIAGALNGYISGGGNGSGPGAVSSAGFDPQDASQALSMMSKMDEYSQRAAQGGMLTPPQPVIQPVGMGGRGDDDGNNSNTNNNSNP